MNSGKHKEVVVSLPGHGGRSNGFYDEEEFSSSPVVKLHPRNATSKYDFVKVKVWLGDNADHYYVLSRFLLSRMLTVTKIPNHVAVKIALELKKLLIDNSLLDVSQLDLEANLFKLMERRGYDDDYINRYKMMTRFHHQRVPLVILVCGTACVGKSTIATHLAQRLNLPNVLQTDMVYELLRTSTDAPLASVPIWAQEFGSFEELITEFRRECRVVRKGLAGDLKKALKDGKPIIIEGLHLDPIIYLLEEDNKIQPNNPAKTQGEHDSLSDHESRIENGNYACSPLDSVDGSSSKKVNEVADILDSSNLSEHVPHKKDREREVSVRREKSEVEPIIIPIVLNMAEFDHKALLEEWISTHNFGDKDPEMVKDRQISNMKIIQDYLCSFESQGVTIANVSPTMFQQTLDWLHAHLLQRIEEGISSHSNKNQKC